MNAVGTGPVRLCALAPLVPPVQLGLTNERHPGNSAPRVSLAEVEGLSPAAQVERRPSLLLSSAATPRAFRGGRVPPALTARPQSTVKAARPVARP